MYRKINSLTEVEYLHLDPHRFHAVDDNTGEVETFYTARERNEFIDHMNAIEERSA